MPPNPPLSSTSPPTKSSIRDQLEELQREELIAAAHATALGRELTERQRRLHGYLDDHGLIRPNESLFKRQPEPYDADGIPRREDSPAGRLAAEIADTSAGLEELAAEHAHAQRLAQRAKENTREFVVDNLPAIYDSFRPESG